MITMEAVAPAPSFLFLSKSGQHNHVQVVPTMRMTEAVSANHHATSFLSSSPTTCGNYIVSSPCSDTSLTSSSSSSSTSSSSTSMLSDHHSVKRSRDGSSSDSADGAYAMTTNAGSYYAAGFPASCLVPADSNSMYSGNMLQPQEQQQQQQQLAGNFKKNRPNTYIAPLKVSQHSFLSAMGSLAATTTAATLPNDHFAAAATTTTSSSFLRVPIRRQLSASKLDPFLSRHSHHGGDNHNSMTCDDDGMDLADHNEAMTRPRSMSF